MTTEDRKQISLLLINGNSINLVTRAPLDTILQTLYGSNDEWIDLHGIDGSPGENPVQVKFQRTLLVGSIIGKFYPPVHQMQRPGGLIQ